MMGTHILLGLADVCYSAGNRLTRMYAKLSTDSELRRQVSTSVIVGVLIGFYIIEGMVRRRNVAKRIPKIVRPVGGRSGQTSRD